MYLEKDKGNLILSNEKYIIGTAASICDLTDNRVYIQIMYGFHITLLLTKVLGLRNKNDCYVLSSLLCRNVHTNHP